MRPALLVWALAAFSSVSSAASDKEDTKAAKGDTPAPKDDIKYTTFNGIQVPPMLEIDGPKFAETVKDGYW